MNSRNFSNVPVLWKPNEKSGKLMRKFKKTIEDKYQLQIGDYWDFHKWSIDNSPQFWSEIWNFAGIICSKSYNKIIDCDAQMDGPKDWFQGARLNFAENLLKYRDDRVALILTGEDREVEKVTYAQLYEDTKLYAAAFRKFGLKKGDVVVCYMSNRKEAVLAMMAVVSIGATWAGALPLLGPQSVVNRFIQVNPRILIAVDRFTYQGEVKEMLNKIKEVTEGLPTLEKVIMVPSSKKSLLNDISGIRNSLLLENFLKLGISADGSVPPMHFEQVSFSHPVFVNYTSGTTGLPKAVVHGCGVGWVTWNMVTTLLSQGFTLLLFEGNPYFLTPTYLWDLVDEFGVTNIFMPCSVMDEYHKREFVPRNNHHLSSLKVMLLGASVVRPQIYDFVYKRIKHDVMCCASYGSTELMGSCLILETTMPIHQGETNAISLGDKLEIVDQSGSSVFGEVGELVISKPVPNLFVGLWGDPDGLICRKAYFSNHPGKYSTGDNGIINPHTKGVIICFRSDETLKQRGCRFGSAEIYNVVDAFSEIRDSLCVSQYNKDMEERAVLFLKIREGHIFSEMLVERIREAIEKELTIRHVPDVILETKSIPYSINGKKMEITVKKIINNMPFNADSIRDPECLKDFYDIPELQRV